MNATNPTLVEPIPWAFRNEFDPAWISIISISQLCVVGSFVVRKLLKNEFLAFVLHVVAQIIMMIYEMVLMGSRMHYLNGVEYNAMSKKNAFVGWLSPNGGACTIEDLQNRSALTNTGGDVCNIWWVPVDGSLLSAGIVKFTVGLGLFLYPILLGGTLYLDYRVDQAYRKADGKGSTQRRILIQLGLAALTFIIENQQFCVLVPLTSLTYGGSGCVALDVPTSQVKALCYYKWATTLIPGIGLMLGAGLCAAIAIKSGDPRPGCVFGLVGLLLGVPGAVFVGFWIVGGFGIGVWFYAAQFTQGDPLAIMKTILPLDMFLAALRFLA